MTLEIVTSTMKSPMDLKMTALANSMESTKAHITLKNLKNVPQVAQLIGSVTTSVILHAKLKNAKMMQEIVTTTNQAQMDRSLASA